MSDKVIFDLIMSSKSLLTLIKANGDTILNSRVFDNFISDKLPYKSNLLEMLINGDNINADLLSMLQNGEIDCSKFPQKLVLKNNETITLHCNSSFDLDNEKVVLIELLEDSKTIDAFTNEFIKSENIFTKNKRPSIVFDSLSQKILATNNKTENYILNVGFENSDVPNVIFDCVEKLVEKSKIGGVSSETYNLVFPNREATLNFECCGIDSDSNYHLITFTDNTYLNNSNKIISLDKERAHNIIDVIPGTVFEFEAISSDFKFTYISENIKKIVGISAKHIVNNSKKLFGLLKKHDRARLHYFFTSLTEEERKIRNEFKVIDYENNTKWITITWHETYSEEGVVKGTGYIDDITEKKKIQIQKQNLKRRKELKEYFSINLLKQSSSQKVLEELAELIVKKLFLQDVIIYMYNHNSKILEYSTSYSSLNNENRRHTFPKKISINKGIIGRVVKSQKSEIIDNSSDDDDYYFFDKPCESEITVPIIFEGELLGIIDSEHVNPNFFSSEHLYLLEDIAESLAASLVQRKRQNENLKFHSTLSLLYNHGKIFEFEFDLKTRKFNDSCIDNIIDLVGIKETSKKIEIYNNSKLLLKHILHYDLKRLANIEGSLDNTEIEPNELNFRIISELGYIKWLKVNISKNSKEKHGDAKTIVGTIQDISKIKELELKISKNSK